MTAKKPSRDVLLSVSGFGKLCFEEALLLKVSFHV
jgi:hypothetical protein